MRDQKNNRGDSSGKKDFSKGSRSEGGKPPERRERSSSYEGRSESKPSDNRGRKPKSAEGRSDSRPSDSRGRSYEGRSSEGRNPTDRKPRSFEGTSASGSRFGDRNPRSAEGRPEGRSYEGRSSEGRNPTDRRPRSTEGRPEGRSYEGRSSEGRNPTDRRPRSTEGRSEGRSYEGRSSEGRNPTDRKPRSFEGRSEGRNPTDRKPRSTEGRSYEGRSSETRPTTDRAPRSTEGRFSERAERNYEGRSSSSDRQSRSFDNKRVGTSSHRKVKAFEEGIKYSDPLDLTNPNADKYEHTEYTHKKESSKEFFKETDENSYEDETRNVFIYGRHPVIEALKSDTPVNKVWIAENTRDTSDIVEYIKEKNIPYKIVNKLKLNSMVGENTNHQGVVAEVSGKEYTEFSDLIDLAQTKNVFYIMLDKVEDPHNLGAIIRTADAAGVDAIIISKHRAVGLTGIVAKTAAGALDRMKVSRVTNLPQALEELKANNVWSVGVDMDGDKVYTDSNLKGSLIVVMGGEGQGLTRLLKDKCDFVVKIPMQDTANSLNVSVATALMTYEVYRQREFK